MIVLGSFIIVFVCALALQYSQYKQKITWLERGVAQLQKDAASKEEENCSLRKALEEERVLRRVAERENEEAKKLSSKMEELIATTKVQLQERFEVLSNDAFFKSQKAFFNMAKETFDQYSISFKTSVDTKTKEVGAVVEPLHSSLQKMEKKVEELELVRRGAYDGLLQQISQLSQTHTLLHKETSNLAKALKDPTVRGRWGEIQLKRVVEVAGMLPYCDFEEQVHVSSADGAARPDMVVKLPNERIVVIDAKVSLAAYLDAMNTDDIDIKKEKLTEHAKMVRQHVVKLAQKKYWDQFPKAPDFVILFLHGDCFLVPALEHDLELLEFASEQKVLLATPTSLIALLKVIAYGWQEAKIEEHAKLIVQEAKLWLERSNVLSSHLQEVGKNLERSMKAHEKATSSFERRLLPSVRRLCSSDGEELPLENLTEEEVVVT